MRLFVCAAAVALAWPAAAQSTADEYQAYGEHPRLLLKPQRLRLLRRERERQSMRWTHFATLIDGKARMPEPLFAHALYRVVSGQQGLPAMAPAGVRDAALAADWLAPTDEKLLKVLRASLPKPVRTFSDARDRAFAALVLGDGKAMQHLIEVWWRKETAPRLERGDLRLSHSDVYPFVELLHTVRDNLQIEMRDDVPLLFRDLAAERVLSYYPAAWPAAENEYRVPFFDGKAEPDLNLAALTRASEFALVAYENNAQEMQFLQGWLMQDRFLLKSAFGAPYEFLWANPYQPGLPFEKLPTSLHNPRSGTVLVRSSWDEDATWLGYINGEAQVFDAGAIKGLKATIAPVILGEHAVLQARPDGARFSVRADDPHNWFLLGLKPRAVFDIETDDEGMRDERSDRGGILALQFRRTEGQTVIVHLPRQ